MVDVVLGNISNAMAPKEVSAIDQKRPPPEKPGSRYTRTFVIVSFWLVVILLGIPVWIWTTSIHRARLPLEEMREWADGKVTRSVGASCSY